MSPASACVVEVSCHVTRLTEMMGDVYRVFLAPDKDVAFHAGQYLEILLPGGKACAFSIASSPANSRELELHIHYLPEKPALVALFKLLNSGQPLMVRLPMGSCHLAERPDAPLLFIASSTGFSQMKGMIEHALESRHPHNMHLYWGARRPEGLYLPELPAGWSQQGLLTYHPVVSEADVSDDWAGRAGLLYEAILADEHNRTDTHVFLSGSPLMVYSTIDALVAAGFKSENMHSDVFSYAPR